MFITPEFWNWIEPLLYHPEDQILLHHIRVAKRGFALSKPIKAMNKYRLTEYRLYAIRDKLESLAKLYELEVMSFPDNFSK